MSRTNKYYIRGATLIHGNAVRSSEKIFLRDTNISPANHVCLQRHRILRISSVWLCPQRPIWQPVSYPTLSLTDSLWSHYCLYSRLNGLLFIWFEKIISPVFTSVNTYIKKSLFFYFSKAGCFVRIRAVKPFSMTSSQRDKSSNVSHAGASEINLLNSSGALSYLSPIIRLAIFLTALRSLLLSSDRQEFHQPPRR